MPHNPHPTGPLMARRRAARAAARSPSSHIRTSMPSSFEISSMLLIWLARSTMASVRLKPTPKSSRSAGVPIITAWVDPL
ncbi:hypothetical protein ACVWZZ_008304 [Bradyrhizobium sp. LM6.10]